MWSKHCLNALSTRLGAALFHPVPLYLVLSPPRHLLILACLKVLVIRISATVGHAGASVAALRERGDPLGGGRGALARKNRSRNRGLGGGSLH